MKPIYLVEPDGDTATEEQSLLEEDGFEVRLVSRLDAADGALDSADSAGLVLLTTGPHDGAVATGIIAKATSQGIPVVVLTTDERQRQSLAHVAAVLVKPFDLQEFRWTVLPVYRL